MTIDPDPLTPPECDLRDYPWMPLDVRRLLTSETWVLGTAEQKVAALTLWCESWCQVPAGSLSADDRMLAHLSGAGTAWKRVKDHILRGWVKCSDGRIYHPVVCEKARESWERKLAQRARTEAARAARDAKRNKTTDVSTPPVTSSVTENATSAPTDPVTPSVAAAVTESTLPDQNRPEQESKKERANLRLDAGASPDARDLVWSDGLKALRAMTGYPDGKARALLGKLVKSAGDNCAEVNRALLAAADLRPGDPVAWLTKAVTAEKPSRESSGERLRRELGLDLPSNTIEGFAFDTTPRVIQ